MTGPTSLIRFDRFDLDLRSRSVVVRGANAKLGGRAFDVLAVLVEHCPKPVGTNEMMSRVWPKLVVEDNTLQVHISTLRKALGADAIITIPGRGYQLAAVPVVGPAEAQVAAASAPTPHAPLIARDDELWALRALTSQTALLTIVGPPGIGKTRLALEWMATASNRRTFLVELAPLSDEALVTSAISSAVGAPPTRSNVAVSDLIEHLRGHPCLLVLDNCEHVLRAVANVVEAISKARIDVQIIATSQQPLRVSGERVYRLPPLAVPARSDQADARSYGALVLFETRVRDAASEFSLTPESMPAAVEICQLLDGNPLAIELAAARVRVLGVAGVRERLVDRFRLLTSGSPSAPAKQRSLEAAFEWSYRLLTEDERVLFERLGTFVGGFSLDAAQQIGSSSGADHWTVLDLLQSLIDRSLVVVELGEQPRYRLLECARAYALERLAEHGTFQATMDRHAEIVCGQLEAVFKSDFEAVIGSSFLEFPVVRKELDNLRSALSWVSAKENGGLVAVRLASYGSQLFGAHGLGAEGFQWCCGLERLLVDGNVPALDAARYWLAWTDLADNNADPRTVLPAAERALQLYRGLGNRIGIEVCNSYAALLRTFLGEFEKAQALLPRADELDEGTSILTFLSVLWLHYYKLDFKTVTEVASAYSGKMPPATRALASVGFAVQVAYANGDDEALPELLQRWREQGEVWERVRRESPVLSAVLPAAYSQVGLLDEAKRLFDEGIRTVRRCHGGSAHIADHLALHLFRCGRTESAARLTGWSEHLFATRGRLRSSDGRRSHAMLAPLLAAKFSSDELMRLKASGRGFDDDAIAALMD